MLDTLPSTIRMTVFTRIEQAPLTHDVVADQRFSADGAARAEVHSVVPYPVRTAMADHSAKHASGQGSFPNPADGEPDSGLGQAGSTPTSYCDLIAIFTERFTAVSELRQRRFAGTNSTLRSALGVGVPTARTLI